MPTVRYTVAQGEVIAEKRGGVRSLYTPDPLGSTIALIDNTQTITDTWVYWPYGEVKTRTGTTATPFQYIGSQGYYHDSDSRAYVRARYLDKAKARWMTEDPIGFDGGDWNLHCYVSNRPLVLVDPLGKREIKPIYGKYCGPQTVPGEGDGIDDLDNCCKEHDECWAQQVPPCTAANQWTRPECRKCTDALCTCARKANCGWNVKCNATKAVVIAYACYFGGSKPPKLPPGVPYIPIPYPLGQCFPTI